MTVEPPGGSGAPMSERMQSLLSRAVEDQLSEQRQLAGALSELRGQLARIAADVEALRHGGSEAPSPGAGALAEVSSDVREAVRLLGERLDGVARLVQQRGVDLSELKASVAELQGAVRSHTDALAGVSGGLGALPAFGDRIAGLQDNLTGLHERLAGLDEVAGSVTSLQQHVDAVGQDLRELRSAFAGIAARVAELPGRAELDGVVARIGDVLDERRGESTERLRSMSRRLDEMAEGGGAGEEPPAIESLRAELARFAETMVADGARADERLDALDARLSGIADQLDAQAAEHGSPAGSDERVTSGLAELQEAIGALRERLDEIAAEEEPVEDEGEDVASVVEEAVAAAEARLTAHIDEAVLALAEALLRRKSPRGASPVVPAAAATPVPSGALEPVVPVADEADEADEADDDVEPDAFKEDDEPPVPDDEPHASWQTPPPAEPPVVADEGGKRKRPWWRPGD